MNEIMLDNSCLPVMSVCDLCAAPEDFYHADRTVDFHVMIYVVEGVVYVTEGDVDYEIHAGEMLFLKSGIRHRGKRAIERGTRWYFIHFYLEESGGMLVEVSAQYKKHTIRIKMLSLSNSTGRSRCPLG